MDLNIREANEADSSVLRDYAERLFTEAPPGIFRRPIPTLEEEVAFIRSHVESPNSTLLLAEVDGALVGVLGLVGESLPEHSHTGTFGVSVDREWRGRGVGGALIEESVRWAVANGITRVQAYVFDTNPRALALYERHGFEREGLCRSAIMRDGMPIDVVMIARLLSATSQDADDREAT